MNMDTFDSPATEQAIRHAIRARRIYAHHLCQARREVREAWRHSGGVLAVDMAHHLARHVAKRRMPRGSRALMETYGRCGTPKARAQTVRNIREWTEQSRHRMHTLPCGMSDALGDSMDQAGRIAAALERYDTALQMQSQALQRS